MFVLRNQPKGARFASFGLGLCVFALMPTEIGYQDIASLLARQPGVAERWQKRVFSSAGTIQVATFSFRPSDRNLLAANRDLSAGQPRQSGHRHHGISDAQSARRAAAALSGRRFSQGRSHAERRSPRRDAAACGNRSPAERAPATEDPATSNASVKGAKTAETAPSVERAPLDPELQAALSAPPLPQYDMSLSLETKPQDDLKTVPDKREAARTPAPSRDGFSFKTSSLFFGSSLGSPESIERWQPGEEPSS